MLNTLLGKAIFKLNGWTYDNKPELWSNKQIVIGFPHTTNMDTVRALALFNILNRKTNTLIKKELFFWPLSTVLNAVGGLPIDRQQSQNLVQNMINEFNQREQFTLVLAPEGTRGKDSQKKGIKTGFWHIAKGANVPIVLMLADNANKRGRFLGKIIPTELETDLETIYRLYAEAGVDIR